MLLFMTQIQKARTAVFTYFLLCGAVATIWATHIPVIEKTLHLSHGQIGTLILILGSGALAAMQFVGALVDRFGSAKSLVGISIGLGLALMLPGLAIDFWTLGLALFVLGGFIGGTDIAMNAHALEVEKAYGRPIFSAFHAMWSIGGVLGAVVAGIALAANMPMALTLTLWGILTMVIGLSLKSWLLPTESKAAAEKSKSEKSRGLELVFVLFVGLVSASGAIIEGVGIDWSALYSIDQFKVTTATAAISITVFSAAMAAVRFVADKVVGKIGRVLVIRYGAAISGVGILVALIAPSAQTSWFGWALAGIGISAVVPQCMAFGSEIGAAEHQGRNLAKVVGLTYAGVLGGPAIIGFLGQSIGLQASLTLGAALAAFVAAGTIVMTKGKKFLG